MGDAHPDTLASRSNLAGAYETAGDLARAIPPVRNCPHPVRAGPGRHPPRHPGQPQQPRPRPPCRPSCTARKYSNPTDRSSPSTLYDRLTSPRDLTDHPGESSGRKGRVPRLRG
ncbi:hypothetical protein [Streptomyces sp. CA-106131]|uniref:hypothetical protein n=1 Tax=Streptomyces sp. CA-106131 TaxID=3240045 RepID=UPI003D93053F